MFLVDKMEDKLKLMFCLKSRNIIIGIWYLIISILLAQSAKSSFQEEQDKPLYSIKASSTFINKEAELQVLKNILRKSDLEFRILFLCTGNSCRSQMAEGWARHLGGNAIEVQSAGIEAHGLNPRAVKIMNDAGINILNQFSKMVDKHMFEWADLVITVCSDADEHCPVLPLSKAKIHWPFIDPAKVKGEEEEVLKVFQSVSNEIKAHVLDLIASLKQRNHIS